MTLWTLSSTVSRTIIVFNINVSDENNHFKAQFSVDENLKKIQFKHVYVCFMNSQFRFFFFCCFERVPH